MRSSVSISRISKLDQTGQTSIRFISNVELEAFSTICTKLLSALGKTAILVEVVSIQPYHFYGDDPKLNSIRVKMVLAMNSDTAKVELQLSFSYRTNETQKQFLARIKRDVPGEVVKKARSVIAGHRRDIEILADQWAGHESN
jgi:hypothetical protein